MSQKENIHEFAFQDITLMAMSKFIKKVYQYANPRNGQFKFSGSVEMACCEKKTHFHSHLSSFSLNDTFQFVEDGMKIYVASK